MILSMSLISFCFFQSSLQQHQKIHLHLLGELNNTISLLFSYERYFSDCLNHRWVFHYLSMKKNLNHLFLTWIFFCWCFISRYFSVFLWPGKIANNFLNIFYLFEILDSLRPCASFSALEIFLISMTFLFFWR